MYHHTHGDPRGPNAASSTASTTGTATAYSSTSPVASTRLTHGGSLPPPPPQSLIGSMAPPSAYPQPPQQTNATGASTPASTGVQWYTGDQPRLPPLPHGIPPLDQLRPPQATSATTTPGLPHGRIITVFSINPQQGPEDTQITVVCDLNFPVVPGSNDEGGNLIRLIIGDKDVDTGVQPPTPQNNYYLVTAKVPALHEMKSRGYAVSIHMEALTERYGVAERLSLGDFHFIDSGPDAKRRRSLKLEEESPRAKSKPPRRRNGRPDGYAPALPNSFVYDSPPPSPQPGLVRTTQMHSGAPVANNPYVVRTKARLEVEGDLNDMKCGWSGSMWQNRRCLVQFTRRQVGATVHASFQAVEERDWTPNMIVISCLWHEARGECYFTSVDAIYLLECLMATRYTTEEKNRIRRNLESFKPTTLQKNEGQWQDFYAHIMSYPNPKPRNIDKGLKVFPWGHLEQALKKIFGNYSAYIQAPFQYGNAADASQALSYGHQNHAGADGLSYPEDRAAVHHAAAAAAQQQHVGSGADGVSAYVGLAGNSTNSTDSRDFSNYVNMSPASTPAYPRDFGVPSYSLSGGGSSSSNNSDPLNSQYPFSNQTSHTASSSSAPYTTRPGPSTYNNRSHNTGGPSSSSPSTNTQESSYPHAHTYPPPS